MTNSSTSSPRPAASSPGDDRVLDLTGEVCPFTFVRTKLAMEELPLGARLRVIVDHEPAVRNIPRSAREWGQDVVATEPVGEHRWAIVLSRVR